jgi:hypothetical protein
MSFKKHARSIFVFFPFLAACSAEQKPVLENQSVEFKLGKKTQFKINLKNFNLEIPENKIQTTEKQLEDKNISSQENLGLFQLEFFSEQSVLNLSNYVNAKLFEIESLGQPLNLSPEKYNFVFNLANTPNTKNSAVPVKCSKDDLKKFISQVEKENENGIKQSVVSGISGLPEDLNCKAISYLECYFKKVPKLDNNNLEDFLKVNEYNQKVIEVSTQCMNESGLSGKML